MAQAFAPAVPSISASAAASGFIFTWIFLWDFIAFLACLRTSDEKTLGRGMTGSALFRRRRRRQRCGGALPARTRAGGSLASLASQCTHRGIVAWVKCVAHHILYEN